LGVTEYGVASVPTGFLDLFKNLLISSKQEWILPYYIAREATLKMVLYLRRLWKETNWATITFYEWLFCMGKIPLIFMDYYCTAALFNLPSPECLWMK
jgi:hypothetical protein